MTSTSTAGLDLSVVTTELRSRVVADPDQIHYQSVLVTVQGEQRPGLVSAASLQVPSAGQYELYLIYDLVDVQNTLTLIQQTLIAGSLALVVTIGVVTFFVVRLAIGPVRRAAKQQNASPKGSSRSAYSRRARTSSRCWRDPLTRWPTACRARL
jgi:hypothetical protein